MGGSRCIAARRQPKSQQTACWQRSWLQPISGWAPQPPPPNNGPGGQSTGSGPISWRQTAPRPKTWRWPTSGWVPGSPPPLPGGRWCAAARAKATTPIPSGRASGSYLAPHCRLLRANRGFRAGNRLFAVCDQVQRARSGTAPAPGRCVHGRRIVSKRRATSWSACWPSPPIISRPWTAWRASTRSSTWATLCPSCGAS